MQPLHGVGVLVTRPRLQAAPLCRLLEAQGASTYRLPAIDIKPLARSRRAQPRESVDLIVFCSSNAVRYGAPLLEQRRDLDLAAIGPATARALNQAGYRVALQSEEGFDSEALLRHPRLKALAGKRILIVKGRGGRELLQEEFMRRGAQVSLAEVYERERACPSAAELAALEAQFAGDAIHVVTATSVEVGAALLELATPALRAGFERAHWVVPGERVAAALRERGLAAPQVQAASAEDQDLVAALVGWRAGESGA